MKLQRTSDARAVIDIYTQQGYLCADFSENGGPQVIYAVLNEQEVEDLITMLQYYKLQVWPDGA